MPGTSYMTWGANSASVQIGETISVPYTNDLGFSPNDAGVTSAFNGLATGTVSSGTVSITGVSTGTVTIPIDTSVGNGVLTANVFTLTVTALADDQNFLNERGLAHFWDNIDSTKQDKLTAGSNITISSGTISATQPTVNNATLTIKQNSTTLGTFTANASTGTTVTISTPTRTTIYDKSSGTNANFSTTSAMSNYDDVEITFRDGNSNYATRTVPGSSGSFVLDIVHPGASSVAFWYISRFIVSGTNITAGANNMRKALQASSLATTATQDIYITKMVGIKY